MSDSDSESPSENDWEERGDLAWNEFDWEFYLREQDEIIQRYLAHYEKLKSHPDRIDETAHQMGWDQETWSSDEDGAPAESAADGALPLNPSDYDLEPYTLHKNPVFIATKAIGLSLRRPWELLADDSARVPAPLALAFHASLHRGEEQAVLAIQALDLGDYAMAVSLFKRALDALNRSLALLDEKTAARHRQLGHYRADALPRLFDLREIWLRVMSECREELGRSVDDES